MGGFDAEIGNDERVVAEPVAEAPPPFVEAAPRFGAWHALMTFALMLFGQIAVSAGLLISGIVAALMAGVDPNDSKLVNDVTERLLVPSLFGSAIISILVTLAALRLWAWHLVPDRSPAGLGMFLPPLRQLLLWTAVGLVLGVAYLALTSVVSAPWKGGPLAKLATSGGSGRAAWSILALLFAPLFEELLFRGLMLRGLIASWGVAAGGTIVTILFFVLHLFEVAGYWPAMLAILIMSLATLFARLRTGSLFAAVAVHGAYNAALVIAVQAAALR